MPNGLFNLKQQLSGIQQGAWTGQKTPAVNYLVVAGGGGGSTGGGGAGGLLQGNLPVATGSALTVTVGGGGSTATSGSNSVFSSITATGGGTGGGNPTPTAGTGGSGGGSYTSANPFGQGTSGQGNAGGLGNTTSGGGGGGAGTLGISATANNGGSGGAGAASDLSGTRTTYSGGGGGCGSTSGGAGGAGGGGAGGTGGGTAATANTGGGGGAGYAAAGAAGGSGIVIISYPDTYAAATSTTGSPTVSTSGSGSIYFNGSTNISTAGTGSFNPRSTFTIEFWINASSFSTVSFIGSNTNNLFYFETSGTTLFVGDGTTNTISTTNLPTINTWTHVALSFDGTTYRLFFNGTSQATSTTLLASNTISAFRIAQKNDGTRSLTGYMTNIRVLVGTALYTSNFTAPTAPLTAITNTSLLLSSVSGAYLADSSANSYTISASGSPAWNSSSPFTVTGYKNRVYTWTSSGSITF